MICKILKICCTVVLFSKNLIYANTVNNTTDKLNRTVLLSHNLNKNNLNKNERILHDNEKAQVIERMQRYFDNIKSLVASFIQTSNLVNGSKSDEQLCNGTIYILKDNNKPQMVINYTTGPTQEIRMEGRFLSVINRKTQKKKKYSIKTTPIYNLLSGGMKIEQLKPEITVKDNNILVNIKQNNQYITLVFDITRVNNQNFNINKLIAWTIQDSKSIINVKLDKQQYYINDPKRIPNDIFSTNKNPN